MPENPDTATLSVVADSVRKPIISGTYWREEYQESYVSESLLQSACCPWWEESEACWQPHAATTASVSPRGSPIERARSKTTVRPWRSTSASAMRRLARACDDDSDTSVMSPLVLSSAQPDAGKSARPPSNALVVVSGCCEDVPARNPHSIRRDYQIPSLMAIVRLPRTSQNTRFYAPVLNL